MDNDEAFLHWLTGLIDGEGSFLINRFPGNKRKGEDTHHESKRLYGLRMVIKLRDDDTPILREVWERTGIGLLHTQCSYSGRNKRDNTMWLIHKRDDCDQLIEILDKYRLRSKKLNDYLIWREAVIAWRNVVNGGSKSRREMNEAHWERIGELKDQLEAIRVYQKIDYGIPTRGTRKQTEEALLDR